MKITTNKIVLVAVLSLISLTDTFAATRFWQGGTSSSWTTSSNWSSNSVPTTGDNVIISAGANNYPVLSSSVTVQNLTLNGGSFSANGFAFRTIQNLVVNGGTFDAGSSTIRATNIDINDGDFLLQGNRLTLGSDLTVDGGTLSITGADFQVDNNLVLISGLLDLNYYKMKVDGTYTYEGAYVQESGDYTLNNFVLNFSGADGFGNTILVTNNMTFTNGVLITDNTNLLVFDDNASTSGTSDASHVNGPVRKQVSTNTPSFTFPTGNGSLYAPIRISSINDEQSGDYFTAQYFLGGQQFGNSLGSGLNHISLAEYWILNRGTTNSNNTPTTDARVTLYYDENSRSGQVTNSTDLRVARWNGSTWVNEGRGTGSSNNNTSGFVRSTNRVTNFSPFTLGSSTGANPLPIELIEFNAVALDKSNININWATSSELNNDFFTIEKSLDGINWKEIGKVKAAGNAESVTNYTFIDANGIEGIQFYRLKQTDFDGKYSYSQKAYVNISTLPGKVDVFPVPAKNVLNVNLNFEIGGKVNLIVINSFGQKVIETTSDSNLAVLDIAELASGIYILEIESDGQVIQTKFAKD